MECVKTGPYVAVMTQEHVDKLQGRLRAEDQQEVYAMSLRSAEEGLRMGLKYSTMAWTIMAEDRPVGCFGVVSASLLSGVGVPWMLGTDEIRRIRYAVLRESKAYVQMMLDPFDMLENWVDVRNKVSINWLRWCGFTLDPPTKYGLQGELFHRFWMKKERGYV